MSEKIEPALTREQWDDVRERHTTQFAVTPGVFVSMDELRAAPAAAVAIANFFLPDDDPRKITGKKVDRLRSEAWNIPEDSAVSTWLLEFADALESYLPPQA